jgi:hypothetical protein
MNADPDRGVSKHQASTAALLDEPSYLAVDRIGVLLGDVGSEIE